MDDSTEKDQKTSHDIVPHAQTQVPQAQFTDAETPRSVPVQTNPYAIPAAIIIGFALISLAIYFSGSKNPNTAPVAANNGTASTTQQATVPKPIRPVDSTDHIRGNPNAPIVIVEYSDYDCPFCKEFHATMQKIMDQYGSSGKVAWVYRHFPIQQLHPDAPRLALAGECVADLGGNDAFWKFTDLVFGERGVNEFTDMTRLDEFATTAGVSAKAFESCLASNKTQAAVQADFTDAVNAGAQGTPYSIVLVGGQEGVINGAQPFATVSGIIDTLIAQMNGKAASTTTPKKS